MVGLIVFTVGCAAATAPVAAADHKAATLEGRHVAFLVGEGVHDAETYMPMAYLANRGAEVSIIGVEPGTVKAYNSDFTFNVQKAVDKVNITDFDALVIPGGRSPAFLREHESVVNFARDFFESGRPVAAICHGPQVLVTAGVLEGRVATCFEGMSDELVDAGADYRDEPMIRDGNLITSRLPRDLPAFSKAIEQALLEDVAALPLAGKHVAFLVGEDVHDGETYMPMAYLVNRGAKVSIIGVEPGTVKAYNSDFTFKVQQAVDKVNITDFDALVIPGGRSPAFLREHESVVNFARDFFESGRPVAAICHGPQVLVTAGVLEGRTATCFEGMSDELVDAGADYRDEPMIRDGNLITSRLPGDLPVFSKAIEQALLE